MNIRLEEPCVKTKKHDRGQRKKTVIKIKLSNKNKTENWWMIMMKSLGMLWEESGKKIGLKVRWKDWGFKHCFFEIEKYNEEKNSIEGHLDNGDFISYQFDNANWKIYEEGDEDCARAV